LPLIRNYFFIVAAVERQPLHVIRMSFSSMNIATISAAVCAPPNCPATPTSIFSRSRPTSFALRVRALTTALCAPSARAAAIVASSSSSSDSTEALYFFGSGPAGEGVGGFPRDPVLPVPSRLVGSWRLETAHADSERAPGSAPRCRRARREDALTFRRIQAEPIFGCEQLALNPIRDQERRVDALELAHWLSDS
jgi:hypothetical protein